MLYRILFDTCGPHKAGDVVPAESLGNVAYLLRVGAVEEVPAQEPSGAAPKPAPKTRAKAAG